ncbi:hypothetical protein A3F02_03205 [Candidatus Curtissbacteria bacterium RIFCSPHIGHO2_12_FULL_38_9b]|uniref:Uncharacterized protein n=1 Tax=Candidatus Curtissbacteria bacterium RIFCSPHIGHO2_12_FULL_38_9b TaxID=1797720 RepID=A0A1F5GW56_9BACT|nr:MAG: hypothetical protein A3F02_03205 [Candidatus Curtissbacteria bacterium RIFCSPHIGHO2_12_FULL_38_9b]
MQIVKNDTFKLFLNQFTTVEELAGLIDQINGILKFTYKNTHLPFSRRIRSKVTKDLLDLIIKIEKGNKLPQSAKELSDYFNSLCDFLGKIPKIELILAFEPSAEFLGKIKRWFWENFKKRVVFEIIIKPEIIGGAIIEYNGIYRDFSKAKDFEESIAGLQ